MLFCRIRALFYGSAPNRLVTPYARLPFGARRRARASSPRLSFPCFRTRIFRVVEYRPLPYMSVPDTVKEPGMMPLEIAKPYAQSLKLALIATLFYGHAHGQTPASDSQRELLLATLWIQSSPEYILSTTQTLLHAQRSLKDAVRRAGTAAIEQTRAGAYRSLPPAVIVDLDETATATTRAICCAPPRPGPLLPGTNG
jgi:hypothetical protein